MRRSIWFGLLWTTLAFGGSSIGIFLIAVPQGKVLHCGGISSGGYDAPLHVDTTLERMRASLHIEDAAGDYVRYCDLYMFRRRPHDHDFDGAEDGHGGRHHGHHHPGGNEEGVPLPLNARCGRLTAEGPELFDAKLTRVNEYQLDVTWKEPGFGDNRVTLNLDQSLEHIGMRATLRSGTTDETTRVELNDQYPCVPAQ